MTPTPTTDRPAILSDLVALAVANNLQCPWAIGAPVTHDAPPVLPPTPIVPPIVPPIVVGKTTIAVDGNTDLAALFSTLQGPCNLVGAPSATLNINACPTLRADGVSFNANGMKLVAKFGGTAPQAIKILAADFEFYGATCTATAPGVTFIRTYGKRTYLHGLWATDIRDLVLFDRLDDGKGKDLGGADDGRVVDCRGTRIAGDFTYCCSDNLAVQRVVVDGSANEHNLRWSPSNTGRFPIGALVEFCDLTNRGQTPSQQKETLAIRAGAGFVVRRCRFTGWTEAGTSAGIAPGSHVTVLYDSCEWLAQIYRVPGQNTNSGAQAMIAPGTVASFRNCKFYVDPFQIPISLGAKSSIAELSGTTLIRTIKGGAILRRNPIDANSPPMTWTAPNQAAIVPEVGTVVADP